MKTQPNINKIAKKTSFQQNLSYVKRNYDMYLLLIPGLIFIIIFNYLPMYGITLAFKDFNLFAADTPFMSIVKSNWVGTKHFEGLFAQPQFFQVVRNTILISFYKLIFIFPIPIIIAIQLNEIKSILYKKGLQTILYLPHFISWAVISGMFISILGSDGVVNQFLNSALGYKVMFLYDKSIFRSVLVATDAWHSVGWGSILYLAAITGIDQETYEAATVDGANKFHKILYITIPGISSTIVMMLILRAGKMLDAGFEQIFIMYSPPVYEVADIIGTFVYRTGLGQMNFSLGTAVGLFNSVVAFILTMTCNMLARRITGKSIW